jgi:hypothetical protein
MQSPATRVTPLTWADHGVWLKADFHTHTRFSDGSHTVKEVVAAAAKYGCDVVAITDHSDGGLKAATPEYLADLAAARLATPSITVIGGLEWNVPPGKGQEHAVTLFPSAMENLDTFTTFKERFDDENKAGENPELARDALAFLRSRSGNALRPVVMFSHPSRRPDSTSIPALTYEPLARAVPGLLVGIEGGPGHQRATPLGSYMPKALVIDRWDPMVAAIGGTWDQWLARGIDVSGAVADSDFHGEEDSFWPCQFSATWVFAPDRTVDGILQALHAGSLSGEHGHIVERPELRVAVDGSPASITPGGHMSVKPGTRLVATLTATIPPADYEQRRNRIDSVELIGIAEGKAAPMYGGAPATGQLFTVPIVVPPGGVVVRARGSRTTDRGDKLMFYTNPIRVSVQ